MMSANKFIKIVSFLIFVLAHIKGEEFLEISLPKDYNKYEPPVSPKENDPLEVELRFKSVMIIEIDQNHQTINADLDINSYWIENRLNVTGNTSSFGHKVKSIF